LYVLPYGQMSLWGLLKLASNAYFLFNNYIFINLQEYLSITDNISYNFKELILPILNYNLESKDNNSYPQNLINFNNKSKLIRIRSDKRIGPHNKDILSIIFGSLLGDGHAERRIKGNGTRLTFYQEGSHVSYLLWLHSLLVNLNYCSPNIPRIHTRLGNKGIVRKYIRFNTWTYSSLNWVHDLWYINKIKIVPKTINEYITPLSLAIWIMDDGCKVGSGLKLATNSFSYSDCLLLVNILYDIFKIKASIQSAGVPNQYHIYIWKESILLLREIVLPYLHSSMKYKLYN